MGKKKTESAPVETPVVVEEPESQYVIMQRPTGSDLPLMYVDAEGKPVDLIKDAQVTNKSGAHDRLLDLTAAHHEQTYVLKAL